MQIASSNSILQGLRYFRGCLLVTVCDSIGSGLGANMYALVLHRGLWLVGIQWAQWGCGYKCKNIM
jgi:hypothetical protein